MKLALTPKKLLKATATKDEPLARGFGKLIICFRLNNREEEARLIEALFTVYQCQFRRHLQGSFLEFDQRARRRYQANSALHKEVIP